MDTISAAARIVTVTAAKPGASWDRVSVMPRQRGPRDPGYAPVDAESALIHPRESAPTRAIRGSVGGLRGVDLVDPRDHAATDVHGVGVPGALHDGERLGRPD